VPRACEIQRGLEFKRGLWPRAEQGGQLLVQRLGLDAQRQALVAGIALHAHRPPQRGRAGLSAIDIDLDA
jgi:hypothetical protein